MTIERANLSPIIAELSSSDLRLRVIVLQAPDGFFRGHSFSWFTHLDDGGWTAFWTEHDLGVIGDTSDVVIEEARRVLAAYENRRNCAD